MALKINLINDQKCYKLPYRQLRHLCEFILKSQGARNSEVNVLFTNNNRIKKLNKRFSCNNRPTDVLAFYEAKNKNEALKAAYLGEVVVSVEAARLQAGIYNQSIVSEIRLYITHGLLHLLGCEDSSVKKKQSMSLLEKTLLSRYEKENFSR